MDNLRKTPNYDMHFKYGGKVVDFGGWALSVQFSGILEEHKQVREKVGLFDVSHMGEATVVGEQALAFLQKLVSRDLTPMEEGQVFYTHMLYPNGGTVDDLMVTKWGPTDYFLVINASNAAKDVAWMQKLAQEFPKVKVTDLSADTAELALQGPLAPATMQKLTKVDLSKLGYYHAVRKVEVAGIPNCIISRTGYTGEDGFEVFCDPANANKLWEAIMEAGKEFGIKPIGLGARDTLRFEASMPLYGQELDQNTSPLEAGLGRFVSVDKPTPFIGQEALKKQVAEGLPKKLVGFEMVDRGIPRHNYPVAKNGKEIGYVTTGSFAPTLNKNIGNAFVPVAEAKIGNEFDVIVRGKPLKARIVKTPFYKRKK
ncbi:MAG TPA: glycine cleavage system aminomethyltransferase GcvT [Bacillota bacterium]|jgi:aminomethyltransferase